MIGGAAGPVRLKLPLPFRTTDARTFSEVLEDPGHAKNPKLSQHEMLPPFHGDHQILHPG